MLLESGGKLGERDGFALETTIFTLVIATAVMAVLLSAAITSFRTTTMEAGNTRANYAAEAGAEAAIAQVMRALDDGYLSDEDLATLSPPVINGFSFDSFAVSREGGVVVEQITDGPFSGLSSLSQSVNIYSAAQDPHGNSGAVIVTARAQAIPIFQFGVFYEKDLEITNGPPMYFDGWVHSNGNIYLSSNNAWYRDIVTTPGSLLHDRKDKHVVYDGVYVANSAGDDVQLLFDSRTHPVPDDFRGRSQADFDGRVRTGAHGVDTLGVPLPPSVSPYEIIQPREATDTNLEKNSKWAWKADLYITVDLDHPTLINPGNDCAALTIVRPAGLEAPDNADCDDFFDFSPERFMDGREGRMVDVLDLNIQKLYNWVNNGGSERQISLIYVGFTGSGAALDLIGDGVYPALRVWDAKKLDGPLSVTTGWPLYVWGDYNSDAPWHPAALVGDAVTWLSADWDDTKQPGPLPLPATIAKPTSLYAAIMAGHSSTPCDHEEPLCGATSPYGGGLENFPRFLENWSGGVTMLYRGSLVSLFEAQKATALWGCCDYYVPPNRDWEFDTRFRDPANLPPGTPVVGNVLHTAFRPVH